MMSWRLSYFEKIKVLEQNMDVSNSFSIRKHRAHACSNTIFNYDVYNYMSKKYIKIVLEQTCTLYYQRQNVKKKW